MCIYTYSFTHIYRSVRKIFLPSGEATSPRKWILPSMSLACVCVCVCVCVCGELSMARDHVCVLCE